MYHYIHYLCIGIFIGMVASQLIAYRYSITKGIGKETIGGKTIETAIFALLGLFIAFTYAGAQSRFENRRQLIVEEINAIETAYLRLEVLSLPPQNKVDELFVQYLEERIKYSSIVTIEEAIKNLSKTNKIQNELWKEILNITDEQNNQFARLLILPTLNQMYDIVTARWLAALTHTSTWVIIMFALITIICSILSGFRMAKDGQFSWKYALLFSLTISFTLYIILDFEYVRVGMIQLDSFEDILIETKENIIQQLSRS